MLQDGHFTAAALDVPAQVALTVLLAERSATVREKGERLDDDDPEALHDFRVAIRRLRSNLRVYNALVVDPIPSRVLRGLKRVARSTGPSRDLEVKLEWLGHIGGSLPGEATAAHQWLTARLRKVSRASDRVAAATIRERLDPALLGLTERLALTAHAGESELSLRTAAAWMLRRLSATLAKRLSGLRTIADQDQAHASRIAGKRVRYLLEPLVTAMPAAAAPLQKLRALQDLLGELHDAEVAAAMLEEARAAKAVRSGKRGPALAAGLHLLSRAVGERRLEAWRRLQEAGIPGERGALMEPLGRLADDLDGATDGPVEIERKYLLRGVPDRVRALDAVEIDQGYLPGEQIHERLREVRDPSGVTRFRTVKLGVGIRRLEFEEPIDAAMFAAMWPLTKGRRVRKRRYAVEDGGYTWEIDEFTDRCLVLCEVELVRMEDAPEPPGWLAPWVVQEVTGEAEYLNLRLAR